MAEVGADAEQSRGMSRRAVLRTAAWSAPIVAQVVAAPPAAALSLPVIGHVKPFKIPPSGVLPDGVPPRGVPTIEVPPPGV